MFGKYNLFHCSYYNQLWHTTAINNSHQNLARQISINAEDWPYQCLREKWPFPCLSSTCTQPGKRYQITDSWTPPSALHRHLKSNKQILYITNLRIASCLHVANKFEKLFPDWWTSPPKGFNTKGSGSGLGQSCRGSLAVAQTKGLLMPPLDSFNYGGTRPRGLLVPVTRLFWSG
jgi:hypothetical protein